MGKVNIGLRGWRFDEDVVFDDEGRVRPLGVMDPDARDRVLRLTERVGDPCDACWLIHGDEDIEQCNVAEVVYGEPLAEVLLCADHEAAFHYWYGEAGGERFRGTDEFQDRFHEWFAAGNRAPAGYGGVEHVETEPAEIPDPQVLDQSELNVELAEDEQARIDLRNMRVEDGETVYDYGEDGGVTRRDADELDDDEADADDEEPVDVEGVDLGTEYPSG